MTNRDHDDTAEGAEAGDCDMGDPRVSSWAGATAAVIENVKREVRLSLVKASCLTLSGSWGLNPFPLIPPPPPPS